MELTDSNYILYVSYDKNKNLIDFCQSIKVNINPYDGNVKNLIKIHYVIFNESNYDKMEIYRNLISDYINNLVNDIISHTEIHNSIKNSYIMDYIRTKMIEYEKTIHTFGN